MKLQSTKTRHVELLDAFGGDGLESTTKGSNATAPKAPIVQQSYSKPSSRGSLPELEPQRLFLSHFQAFIEFDPYFCLVSLWNRYFCLYFATVGYNR